MKTKNAFIILLLFIIGGCRDNSDITPLSEDTPNANNYLSLAEFYQANEVQSLTYSMNAVSVYSFTTAQGTHVSIPANAFVTLAGAPVTGTVNIEFKDVYKKSDMMLTDLSTTYYGITPMVSAGMFYIKATENGNAIKLAPGQHLTVNQPIINALPPDTGMRPMVMMVDSGPLFGVNGWVTQPFDSLHLNPSNYIFSLYQFSTPEDSGTWCNSDNPSYFNAYPNTTLTLHNTDNDSNITDVFLVFTGVNSMVHVYKDYLNPQNFPYNYAPSGLSCTAVCVSVRNAKLYSSFTPITISANQTVNFTMTETTTDAFKTQLAALN